MGGLIFGTFFILIIIWITVGSKAAKDYDQQMRQKKYEKEKRLEANRKAEQQRLKEAEEKRFKENNIDNMESYKALQEENEKLKDQIEDLLQENAHREIRIQKLIDRLEEYQKLYEPPSC